MSLFDEIRAAAAAVADRARSVALDPVGIERLADALAAERRRMPWMAVEAAYVFEGPAGNEWHGTNVFYRDGDRVFRTYFINNRGDEQMGSTWNYLDITALGRQEIWEDSPEGYPQTQAYGWWNRHDEYDEGKMFEHALSEATASQRGASST